MKILLMRPPFACLRGAGQSPSFPIGIGSIAAVLEQNGFEVKIYHPDNLVIKQERYFTDEKAIFETRSFSQKRYVDALRDDKHRAWQELRETLKEHEPDIIGISVLSPEVGSALKVSSLCKAFDRDCKVVWGGVHPTFLADDCLKNPAVDFVVRGEGEHTMLELCQNLRSPDEHLHIKGLSFRSGNSILHNPRRELIKDLNELPFPARHLVLYPEAFDKKAMGSIMMSRGCPWRCGFCSSRRLWDKKARFRSPENVFDEIRKVVEDLQIKHFMFWDDAFTINREIIIKYCKTLINSGIGIAWRTATRADLVDDEILSLMKRAGCVHLDIGIETGSPRIHEVIKKDVNVQQTKRAVSLINKNRISSGAFFMAGFPQETKNDLGLTFELMKEIKTTRMAFNVFDPMPGSELFDTCVRMGLIPANVDWKNFPYWPDAHYAKNLSEKEFTNMANEMGAWAFKYNNSFRARLGKVKPFFFALIRRNPLYLTRLVLRAISQAPR